MKCLLLIFVVIAACTASVPIQKYKKGRRFFHFPGDDGTLRLVDSKEPVNSAFIDEYTRNPSNCSYLLFTRDNRDNHEVLAHNNAASVTNSHFSFSKITVFLAHGWHGDGGNKMNNLLIDAFLQNDDVNVIVLDWGDLAKKAYTTARGGTAAVGRGLGQFVNWLVSIGLSYDKVHLVGFSLGGHLVGNAGRETGSRVKRITALDPAGPLWGLDSNRLVRTDARYVEVIHTDTIGFGHSDPCGDADFYPNGGFNMPGCLDLVKVGCSHSRSYEYMASSVKNNHFQANECGSVREATLNKCTGTVNPMGNSDINKTRAGIFRVNTEKDYPF